MTRLSPRVALSVTGLSLAMMVGALLLTPAIAEKAGDTKEKIEKKVIIRKSFGGHHKPDAAELKDLIAAGREASTTITTDAAEAKRLLDDANAALAKGDEATARALVHEAHRLLDCGGPQVMGFGGGPGMAHHAFGPEGDFDFDIDFDWQGAHGGPSDVQIWSAEGDDMQAKELKIEIDGDTMTAEGIDKDGKAFKFEGTPEEVHAQLEAKGISMQKHHARMAGGGGHHMFMGGPGQHEKELRIELPEGGAVPPFFGMHGGKMIAPLTDADRADLEQEVAAMSEEAAKLLRAGKSEEGLEKLHEAFGQSIRLGMAMDGKTIRIEKRIGGGAGDEIEIQIEAEVETGEAEAPEAESVQPPHTTGRQA